MLVRIDEATGKAVELATDDDAPLYLPEDQPYIELPEYFERYSDYFSLLSYDFETEKFTFDVAVLKSTFKSMTAAKRWTSESGGITLNLFPEIVIPTDTEAQAKISSIFRAYEDGDLNVTGEDGEVTEQEVSFNVGESSVKMGRTAVAAIKRAVTVHVQLAFNRQGEIYELIDSTIEDGADLQTVVELFSEEIDKWPRNSYVLMENGEVRPINPTPEAE